MSLLAGVAAVRLLEWEDSAEMEWTEGAGAEGAEWIECGDDGVRVLQEQAAGRRECENRAECSVDGFDLHLAVAGERRGALEGEGEALREREVVVVGERNYLVRR